MTEREEGFDESHVEPAGQLLSQRFNDDVQARLSAVDSSPEACAGYVAAAHEAGARGVALIDNEGLAGYLIAAEGDNDRGRHVWSARECHAYRDDPEALRRAYAALSNGWVNDGHDHHYAVVSATDERALNAWFGLTFGHEQAHAIRRIDPVAPPEANYLIRRAGGEDIQSVEPLVRLIYEAQSVGPVFAHIEQPWWDELLPGHLELLEDPTVGYFIAQEGADVLGYATLRPIPDDEATLLKPRGTVELIVAGTIVAARGRGVMRALIAHAFSWARDEGYWICVTDWRVANLNSSLAWPALGFIPCAYRLHRIIDPRVMTGLRD